MNATLPNADALDALDFEPACEVFHLRTGETCNNSAVWQRWHTACGFLLGIHCHEHHLRFQQVIRRKLRCKGCLAPISYLALESEATPL